MARHKACDEGNNELLPRSITQWMAVFRLSPSGWLHFWGCTALKIANGTRAMSQFLPCSAPKLQPTQPRMKRQQTLGPHPHPIYKSLSSWM
jgi:hypothetical protein